MTKRQMLQPVSHDGLWLLIANGPPGPIRHELLHGVHGITHALHDEWKDLETENSQGDSVITFSEEKPWYKISWMPQRAPEWVREFRFVRCQPTESGLLWVAATDNDEFWLEQLNRDAHGYFDYVETADGLRSPTDVTKLRLLIHRHVSPREAEEQQTSSHLVLLKVHHGSLPDMHPNTLDAFSSEGCAKSIAVNRLCYGLWEALLPYLAEWPLKYWSFRVFGGCIGVALDLVPFREWSNPACPPPVGNLLSISLAELTTAGRHKSVPWSRANVKASHYLEVTSGAHFRHCVPNASRVRSAMRTSPPRRCPQGSVSEPRTSMSGLRRVKIDDLLPIDFAKSARGMYLR